MGSDLQGTHVPLCLPFCAQLTVIQHCLVLQSQGEALLSEMVLVWARAASLQP